MDAVIGKSSDSSLQVAYFNLTRWTVSACSQLALLIGLPDLA